MPRTTSRNGGNHQIRTNNPVNADAPDFAPDRGSSPVAVLRESALERGFVVVDLDGVASSNSVAPISSEVRMALHRPEASDIVSGCGALRSGARDDLDAELMHTKACIG